MVVRKYPLEKIKAALRQISGRESEALRKIDQAYSFKTAESSMNMDRLPLKIMFESRFLVGTLMLWLTYFMGLLLYYLLTSWMPIFVRGAGYSVSQAAVATALFPLGGVIGATLCGWLMGRVNATRVVSGAYLLTSVLLVVLARSTTHFGYLLCATFLAGLAMNGAQTSMPVLAAAFYPTYGRASGVAWMLGVGRVGGIAGAYGGGLLFQAGMCEGGLLLVDPCGSCGGDRAVLQGPQWPKISNPGGLHCPSRSIESGARRGKCGRIFRISLGPGENLGSQKSEALSSRNLRRMRQNAEISTIGLLNNL